MNIKKRAAHIAAAVTAAAVLTLGTSGLALAAEDDPGTGDGSSQQSTEQTTEQNVTTPANNSGAAADAEADANVQQQQMPECSTIVPGLELPGEVTPAEALAICEQLRDQFMQPPDIPGLIAAILERLVALIPEPPAPPAAGPVPARPAAPPVRFVDLDCRDFYSQADAQFALDSNPSNPNNLDADNDGIACEDFFVQPVASIYPVGGVAIGGGGTAGDDESHGGLLTIIAVLGIAGGAAAAQAGRKRMSSRDS